MKHLSIIPLGICLLTAGCHAAPAKTPKVLLAQNDSISKIAQVKAGTLKVANASWWGFNKDDATDCLQSAINSGVPKLIVDNMGSDWIINKSLNLVSNQEIVFSDGVVIQAKKDCFHGANNSLFRAANLTNLIMQGEGNVVLRMRKKDYQDSEKYTRAEWRSGISLVNCTNVTLRNLTVAQTGGDGLYLGATDEGYNKNILVEDMNFDGNHRLGMAVISVDGLTIRRCKFVNASGTAPNGGLDFEPDSPGQRLVNCVVEDSLFAHNHTPGGMSKEGGMGVSISPANLTKTSLPISISFNKCLFKDNDMALTMWPIKSPAAKPVLGNVSFEGCTFDHDTAYLVNVVAGSISYLFKDCKMDFGAPSTISTARTPIMLVTDHRVDSPTLGGITFDNVTVTIDKDQSPLRLDFWANVNISDQIKGNLHVKQNQKSYEIKLPDFILQNQKQLEVPWEEKLQEIKAQLPRISDAELQENKKRIDALEATGHLKNNLLQNGDFSSTKTNTAADTAHIGWDTIGYPQNWATWQEKDGLGVFSKDDNVNHDGSLGGAAELAGMSNGCFIQTVDVKPGESFVVQAWLHQVGKGIGSLRVAWQTTDNKWINGSNGPTFYNFQDTDSWRKLEGIITAPDSAGKMVIMPSANYQTSPQDIIWFDDVSVYKIQ